MKTMFTQENTNNRYTQFELSILNRALSSIMKSYDGLGIGEDSLARMEEDYMVKVERWYRGSTNN